VIRSLVAGFSMVWPVYATMPLGRVSQGYWLGWPGSLLSCGEPRQREPLWAGKRWLGDGDSADAGDVVVVIGVPPAR